jgi:hypothetical protein
MTASVGGSQRVQREHTATTDCLVRDDCSTTTGRLEPRSYGTKPSRGRDIRHVTETQLPADVAGSARVFGFIRGPLQAIVQPCPTARIVSSRIIQAPK